MNSNEEIAGGNNERLVLDFEHLPGGRNCMSSSLWKLFNHQGLKITEEMIVGIASGLGFIYWNMKQLPVPFVGGMNGGRFPTILGLAIDRLGGSWKVLKSTSMIRAHKQLTDVLRQDCPALVCVDIGFLNYLSIGGDDHFGMHNVLVYGIDEAKNEAYVSDRFATPLTISLTSLQQARASKYHPFPAENKLLTVEMPEVMTPLPEIIQNAIRENAEFMLNPPISNMGVRGILRWQKELQNYSKLMPEPHNLVRALCEHYVYIETGGSGGALFRRIYSDFLSEAGDILKDGVLRKASSDYDRISDAWSSLAKMILPDRCPTLSEIRDILWNNNKEMEEHGIKAFDAVRENTLRLKPLYTAAEREVQDFSCILEPILPHLTLIHDMEREAMENLYDWSKAS
ncbi:MAG: BtrH N-terminal domain-containing protein [Candidatus Thorarchaeota archaeon]